MNNGNPKFTNEQLMAQAILMGSLKTSKIVDSFSNWLLVGFGAGFILIVSNLNELENFIDINYFRLAGVFFIFSTIFAILQKYFATTVMSGYEADKEGQERLDRLQAQDQTIINNLSFYKIIQEVEKAYWPPTSWIIKSFFDKIKQGDLNASARMLSKCFQIQGWCLSLQVIFHIVIIVFLILSINA